MVQAAEKQLVPFLIQQGFARRNSFPGKLSGTEYRAIFPLGAYERERGDALEVVEIQFDKHRRPQFVINFGKTRSGCVELPWGIFDRGQVGASAFPEAIRLFSSRLIDKWFSVGLYPFATAGSAADVCDEAKSRLGPAVSWFDTDRATSYMRPFGIARN